MFSTLEGLQLYLVIIPDVMQRRGGQGAHLRLTTAVFSVHKDFDIESYHIWSQLSSSVHLYCDDEYNSEGAGKRCSLAHNILYINKCVVKRKESYVSEEYQQVKC